MGGEGHDGIKWEIQMISWQKCGNANNMTEESMEKMEFSRNLLRSLIDVCHTLAFQGFLINFVVVVAIPWSHLVVWQNLCTPLIHWFNSCKYRGLQRKPIVLK